MPEFSERELAGLEETTLEDVPEGYVAPKIERDANGRLLKGHTGLKKPKAKQISNAQMKRLAKQGIAFLTHHDEVALKREARISLFCPTSSGCCEKPKIQATDRLGWRTHNILTLWPVASMLA